MSIMVIMTTIFIIVMLPIITIKFKSIIIIMLIIVPVCIEYLDHLMAMLRMLIIMVVHYSIKVQYWL